MCHTKDYKLGICCFSAKHLALKRKNKDWLVHNQDNVSSWSDIYSPRLLLQWTITLKIQLVVIQYKIIIISTKVTCSGQDRAATLLIWLSTTINYSLIQRTLQLSCLSNATIFSMKNACIKVFPMVSYLKTLTCDDFIFGFPMDNIHL